MINKSMITTRLALIEDALREMKSLGHTKRELFLKNKTVVAAVESYLRRSLEAFFDMARHILVHQGWHEYSLEYKSIAKGMVEKGIISGKMQEQLLQMAGYRNRLVHFYHEVTPEELFQIVQEHIGDIEDVVAEIKGYVARL